MRQLWFDFSDKTAVSWAELTRPQMAIWVKSFSITYPRLVAAMLEQPLVTFCSVYGMINVYYMTIHRYLAGFRDETLALMDAYTTTIKDWNWDVVKQACS